MFVSLFSIFPQTSTNRTYVPWKQEEYSAFNMVHLLLKLQRQANLLKILRDSGYL